MNVFTVIGIVVISVALLALLLAAVTYRLNLAVTQNIQDMEKQQARYKPATTMGFKIPPTENEDVQFQEARKEAARLAAATPRGANMRIGREGASTLRTASKNLKNDPISAFKIASVQGWRGLGEFETLQAQATTQVVAAPKAAGKQVKRKLVPGKDYPVIEITPDMDPAEKRKARIANAKAKSAAMKELKAAGADMVAAPAAAPAARAAAPAAPSGPTATDVGIAEPDLIEITDDMDPADVRKARIANAKAMSAYKKALKAAGVDLSAGDDGGEESAVAEAAPAPAAAAAAAEPEGLSDIPKPDLIEVSDDMDPADVRQARIANAKAISAYKKALKAAGIDPSSVEI